MSDPDIHPLPSASNLTAVFRAKRLPFFEPVFAIEYDLPEFAQHGLRRMRRAVRNSFSAIDRSMTEEDVNKEGYDSLKEFREMD